MEDTTSRTTGAQAFVSRVVARHNPDVPNDAVDNAFLHLNDPNWDMDSDVASSTTAADSYQLDDKESKKRDTLSGKFSLHSDAESQTASQYPESSRADSPVAEVIDYDDESPYAEVRAAVSSVDDPSIPTNTFRVWFLGIFFTIAVSGLNQVFAMRYPSVLISSIVAQLASMPLGKLMERFLPKYKVVAFGRSFSMNPGPWSIKEHTLVTTMAAVVVNGAYATDVIATQRIFFNQQLSFSYQMLLILGSQLFGFGIAGALRQFVVYPSSMLWPGALVNAALFRTLHRDYAKVDPKGHIPRERFFGIVMLASFAYYWIPGYLFTGLSMFSWVCWIKPENTIINSLFGTTTGLGMSVLTFDWSMISYISSPLVTPWWAEANVALALVIFFWIVTPILYYTNTWFSHFLPMSAFISFDNIGFPYDTSAILTPEGLFDADAYRAYSPMYMTTTLAMSYGISFASFSALIVHTFIWFRKDIVRRFRGSLKDERDVHSRLMLAYEETPHWWFAVVSAVSFLFLTLAVTVFHTGMPFYMLLLALFLAALFALPLAMIMAITNQIVPLQIFHELVCGYILPENAAANMIFKAVAYIGHNQAVTFSGNLKLGHYLKVPPKMMFITQVVAAVIGSITANLVQNAMFANIVDFCLPTAPNGFTCPQTNSFGTAAIIWGAIGPARMFSPGQLYSGLLWFFVVGAVIPIPFYFLARRFPRAIFRYFNAPVFFAGLGAMPPATGINYASWALVGFIFNYWIRRYNFRWWMRYNYITSAGLDAGVVFGAIAVFLFLQLPKGGIELHWWGNDVWQTTADFNGMPFKLLEEGVTFGPTEWL